MERPKATLMLWGWRRDQEISLGFGAGVMNTFKTPNGVAKQTIHNTVGS
jgi:hypothetical protein